MILILNQVDGVLLLNKGNKLFLYHMKFIITENQYNLLFEQSVQDFNSLAREFEVTKNQKLSGTAKGGSSSPCEACKLSKTGLFYQEADKILSTYKKGSPEMSKAVSEMLCYNQKVYYGDFKNWCPEGYGLQSVLSKELNCRTIDECSKKIDYYMKNLFTQREPIDWHLILTLTSIATAFIPFVGPFISAGIELADAAYYYNQGDKKTAGMVAMFSLIPFAGKIVSKIPGVKQLGQKAMGELGVKILNKSELTALEKEVAEGLSKNKEMVSQELNKVVTNTINKSLQNTNLPDKTTQKLIGLSKVGLELGTYAGAGVSYDKGYDYLQKNTIKTIVDKSGLDWNFVKSSFGSAGGPEDNKKLKSAWDDGWRPGDIVPEKYQTDIYKQNYSEDKRKISELEKILGIKKTNSPPA